MCNRELFKHYLALQDNEIPVELDFKSAKDLATTYREEKTALKEALGTTWTESKDDKL